MSLAAKWLPGIQPCASAVSLALRAWNRMPGALRSAWRFEDGPERRFRIFPVARRVERERAYRLAYEVYRRSGYAAADRAGLCVSPFDARPDSFTLLAEDAAGRPAGTVTLVFDSEAGLPCDEIFRDELDGLRRAGRKPVEVTRLAIEADHAYCNALLVHLFDFIYIYGRRVRAYTDFVIEVNPRHVIYYRRLLGFEPLGGERPCPRVQGAPAVLLRLDPDISATLIRRTAGKRDACAGHSLYPYFYPECAEAGIAAFLARRHRPMSEEDARYFNLAPTSESTRAAVAQDGRWREPARSGGGTFGANAAPAAAAVRLER